VSKKISFHEYNEKYPEQCFVENIFGIDVFFVKDARSTFEHLGKLITRDIFGNNVIAQTNFAFPFVCVESEKYFLDDIYHPGYCVMREQEKSLIDEKSIHLTKAYPVFVFGGDNVWHNIMENIPYIVYLEKWGYEGVYLLPQDIDEKFLEFMDLLDVPREKILLRNGPVTIGKCCVPRYVSHGSQGYSGHPMIDLCRSFLLEKAKLKTQKATLPLGDSVFIDRKGRRKICNAEEILPLVANKFEAQICYFENHTLAEQIVIASKARIILGPHGAGLVFSLFMPRRSAIIELFSSRMTQGCLHAICAEHNHNYYMLVERVPPVTDWQAEYSDADMRIDVGLLDATFNRALYFLCLDSFVRLHPSCRLLSLYLRKYYLPEMEETAKRALKRWLQRSLVEQLKALRRKL
jgi:hypothetical protein